MPPELKGGRWAGRELSWKISSMLGWEGFQIPVESGGAHTAASDPELHRVQFLSG